MPYTWTDNVGVPNSPCEPQKLADDLMHLKYDMLANLTTDSAIARYDGIEGALQNSLAIIDDSGNISTPSGALSPFLSGYKNKIINGNFDIWQRGTSQSVNGYGSDDRWVNAQSGSTATHSRQSFALGQTDVPGNPKYFSRTVGSSVVGAGNLVAKFQKIESVHSLSGRTVTLSFWAKADANKQMSVEFIQSFGTGGSPSAAVEGIGAQKLSLTTTWQKHTITITIPSINGKVLGTDGNDSLWVIFWFDAGSTYNSRSASLGQQSGTFDIAQVQLEEGSVATPFESRHIGQELALCQRYYEPFSVSMVVPPIGTNSIVVTHQYRVFKRKTPTVTKVSNFITSNETGTLISTNSQTEVTLANSTVGTTGVGGAFTADAEL